jgi:hypothetical protein
MVEGSGYEVGALGGTAWTVSLGVGVTMLGEGAGPAAVEGDSRLQAARNERTVNNKTRQTAGFGIPHLPRVADSKQTPPLRDTAFGLWRDLRPRAVPQQDSLPATTSPKSADNPLPRVLSFAAALPFPHPGHRRPG